MKSSILLLSLVLISGTVTAQPKSFLRVYNLKGKIIQKGYFAGSTDSTLLLFKKDTAVTIVPVELIGKIKTRHSELSPVVISAVTVGLVFGGSSQIFKNSLRGATDKGIFLKGFAIGALAGGITGAIILSSQKRKTFLINGNRKDWLLQKKEIDKIKITAPNTDN